MLGVQRTRLPGQGSGASAAELSAMRAELDARPEAPSFSVVVVVADTQEIWIRATFDSVLAQVQDRVELCVCDNGSTRSHVATALADLQRRDDRVKVTRLARPSAEATAVAEAARLATGDFVVFAAAGDTLLPEALFRVVELLREAPSDVVYTDEEIVDEVDQPTAWIRKPYWSPDLYRARPYLGRLCAVRRPLIDAAGGFADHGAWEYDLLLRVTELASGVQHLALPLYRRRVVSSSALTEGVAEGLPLVDAPSHTRVATEARARRAKAGVTGPAPAGGATAIAERPRVCAIVTQSRPGGSIPIVQDLESTTSIDLEGVFVIGDRPGTDAGVEWVDASSPASAANRLAQRVDCDALLFVEGRSRLAPDADPGWLAAMASRALDGDVGAVGCQLTNPDGTLRYGGMAVNLKELSPSSFPERLPEPAAVPVALHPSNPGFVPAECLVIDADLFVRVGGFNDRALPTAFYDLDLCFRLLDRGLLNVYSPSPSITCAPRAGAPSKHEIAFVWERWPERLGWLLSYQPSEVDLVRPDRVERAMRVAGNGSAPVGSPEIS